MGEDKGSRPRSLSRGLLAADGRAEGAKGGRGLLLLSCSR